MIDKSEMLSLVVRLCSIARRSGMTEQLSPETIDECKKDGTAAYVSYCHGFDAVDLLRRASTLYGTFDTDTLEFRDDFPWDGAPEAFKQFWRDVGQLLGKIER
jgi:hypothetical protein